MFNATIEVRNFPNDRNSTLVITRMCRVHNRWHSCVYRGKRYQVFGGYHTPYFIDLSNPLLGQG